MTENPYKPLTTEPVPARRHSPKSLACMVMFWLSILLGVASLLIAVLTAVSNLRFLNQNQFGLPPYVVAALLLMFLCGFAMLFAARSWRKQRITTGSVVFVGSLVAYFFGPLVLARLLV